MKINSITITNFRCFKSLSINFNPKMNVIIGNNGVGKTAILDAISLDFEDKWENFWIMAQRMRLRASALTVREMLA